MLKVSFRFRAIKERWNAKTGFIFVTGSMSSSASRAREERWMDGKPTGLARWEPACLCCLRTLFANVKFRTTLWRANVSLKWNEEEINFLLVFFDVATSTCRATRLRTLLELSPFSQLRWPGGKASFHVRLHRKYFISQTPFLKRIGIKSVSEIFSSFSSHRENKQLVLDSAAGNYWHERECAEQEDWENIGL